MTRRKQFWFVTGEFAHGVLSHSLLDAWLSIEIANGKYGSEFTKEANRTIEAYTEDGRLLECRTWEGWHRLLMEDTYGDDWEAHIENASRLA